MRSGDGCKVSGKHMILQHRLSASSHSSLHRVQSFDATITMGLLKHVVLPLYALLNAAFAFKCLIKEEFDADMLANWSRDTAKVPLHDLEMHLLHVCGGVMIVLLVNNVAAILVENSHYRGMAVFLQMLFFSIDGYSYYRIGLDIPGLIYGIIGLGLVGLVVHSQEPGIFTKDHGPGNKSKKG